MLLEFLKFQDLTEEQALALLEIRNQEYVRRNMYDSSVISCESHLKWIDSLATRMDRIYWAIVLDGEIVGAIDLTSIDTANSFAEWGYYIASDYFGMGAIVEYSGLSHFMDMGFKLIKAGVKESNIEVYNMHIKSFGFRPCPEFSSEINGIKYLGASLTAQDWSVVRGSVEKKLGRMLKRIQVKWN